MKLDAGETMRLYIAPVGGRAVVVSIEALAAAAPVGESVVKTVGSGDA